MSTVTLIRAATFCSSHQIEDNYIYTLRDYGFIEVIEEKEDIFLKPEELPKLEKIVRFNRDLDINLEGVEVVLQLLERIEGLQRETQSLQNKLKMSSRPNN